MKLNSGTRKWRRPRVAVAGILAVLLPVSLAPAISPASASASAGGATGSSASCPWLNESLSISQRVSMVLAQMTLDDKVSMMTGAGTSQPYVFETAAIPSLCIPAMGEEDGPNGVGDGLTGVTQLPAGVSLAATWDPSLAASTGRSSGPRSTARAPWSTWARP
jgi:beta-glucosidase